MAGSFGLVEDKLREARFFLDQLRHTERPSFQADCYFSAFVSASRSVTFAMQASLEGVPGFEVWYEGARARLKTEALAPLFVAIRNDVVHAGRRPLNRVTLEHLQEDLTRQLQGAPRRHVLAMPDAHQRHLTVLVDALEVCEEYFISLVSVVHDCYSDFKTVVDARWYFTESNFASLGKNFEDAIVELGFPPNWTAGLPVGPESWRVLRSQQSPCLVNDLFERYLNKTIPDPDEL